MIDILICILYVVAGGIWMCKGIRLDSISAPTNYKIVIIKFLMLLVVPASLYIFFSFSADNKMRIILSTSFLLTNEILSYVLFLEIKKVLINYNERKREEVERILKKEKFRFELGMVGFGVIIFIGLLICVLPN
ncbi:hypothetical protein [Dialister invisus]|uniref:hypothetical protein n=1 Tax=Dialister invisus TaxID=218538 RepID=UPI0039995B0A